MGATYGPPKAMLKFSEADEIAIVKVKASAKESAAADAPANKGVQRLEQILSQSM